MTDIENDVTLAVWFTPQPIRDHYDDEEGPSGEFVRQASPEMLAEVGRMAMSADCVWDAFHRALSDAVTEMMLRSKEAR